jgi:hypothetical protein
LIDIDSLFQKTTIITPQKRTIQPGDAFEDTDFMPGFEIVNISKPGCRVSTGLHFFVRYMPKTTF